MFRERFVKVRAELWEVATDLNSLAEAKPPFEDVQLNSVSLVARSVRTVCYLLIRVIDSLP